MEMNYDDMKKLMEILDNNDIPYEFNHTYSYEIQWDGSYVEYRSGHYLILFGKKIECDELDEEDEKWNRG